MNILLIANEFPYPANHGGKVDVLNRVIAFKNAGHKVFLITWKGIKKENIISDKEMDILDQTVDQLIVLKIKRNALRVLNLLRYPSLVAARLTKKKEYKRILNESKVFSPDFIFIDSIYGALLGIKLANDMELPVGVRTHNIEYSYMRGQYLLAKGLKNKLSLFAACLHLKSFEEKLISKCNSFFDISLDDLKFWTSKGYDHGYWLPPISHRKYEDLKVFDFKYEIGFLGNLNAPNNVEGLSWFINNVLPLILTKYPGLRVLILGSEPSNEVIALCKTNIAIELIANPTDPDIYLNHVNIMINPVKFGSGVNIKSVEMLMRNNEVVSTSVGVNGLPKEIFDVFFIADTPENFSHCILDILINNRKKNIKLRTELRELFKDNSIEIVINAMNDLIGNNK
jgi:hypothetical protein